MNTLLASVCVLVVLGAIPARSETDFAKLDVDIVIHDDELTNQFINCILEEAACSEDGLKIRGRLNEVFITSCGECSEEQKNQMRKLLLHVKTNRSDDWTKFLDLYDPNREREESFKAFMEEM